jgi:Ca2+-binding RTX toxin-like protein
MSATRAILAALIALAAGAGDDHLTGGPAVDRLLGAAGDDTLDGLAGGDTLVGGADDDGKDVYSGGPGPFDEVSYGARTAAVTVDLDGVDDDGAGGERDNVRVDVERVTGGAGNDVANGGDGADVLNGGRGADTLYGAAGNGSLNAIDGVGANDDLIGAQNLDSCQSDAGDRETDCEW